jgi:transposase
MIDVRSTEGYALFISRSTRSDYTPFSGSLFVFCNKSRKNLKALYWDRSGFALWQKRLEREHFPWPKTAETAKEIAVDQFRMVLEGIDFWNAHQKLSYTTVL